MRLIQFRAMLNQPNSTGDTAAGWLAAAACAGLECPTKQLFKGHVFAASMPARPLPEDSLLKNASCKFITDLRPNGDLYHQALGAAVVTRSRRVSSEPVGKIGGIDTFVRVTRDISVEPDVFWKTGTSSQVLFPPFEHATSGLLTDGNYSLTRSSLRKRTHM